MIQKPEGLSPDGLRLAADVLGAHARDLIEREEIGEDEDVQDTEQVAEAVTALQVTAGWLCDVSYEPHYPCVKCQQAAVVADRHRGYVCEACGALHILDLAPEQG